jgi:branched-chain amino acid transport system ATP-binding protein
MLTVNEINVYYGPIHAIKSVSFEVRPSEVVALIGANGAGKSTVLKTISGLLRPKTGSVVFDGRDITKTEAHKIVRAGLAHVPEGRRIFLHMTVMENLEMGAFSKKAVPKTSSNQSTGGSPVSRNAGSRSRGRCRAANSRCWP